MFDKIIDFINNYGIYFLFCLLVISIERNLSTKILFIFLVFLVALHNKKQ